ncbi:MAG: J domain-containing protein [Gemmataceae bacterium]|nr:J domain-containing protein [Gemmataceae bacterium]MDW8266824.1 hypothetical protein [Gemmataceae bacterium]
MDRELICRWLGLKPEPWPPDHYSLLGLQPGESDLARIEQKAHERYEQLKRYQLTHPDLVTEAMNRVAQALDCLSHPESKRAYDLEHFPEITTAGRSVADGEPTGEPREAADPLTWLFGPWQGVATTAGQSVRLLEWSEAPPPPAWAAADATPPSKQPTPREALAPVTAQAPGAIRASPTAPPAPPVPIRLSTPSAVCRHVRQTRQLLLAWSQLESFLGQTERRLNRRSEAIELVRQLTAVRQLLHDFPPLLGQAGQPGYLVVTLARQSAIVQTFRDLEPAQREALRRDWQAGRDLLLQHRRFLRLELRHLRRANWWTRASRAFRLTLVNHPGLSLLPLAIAAVNLAFPAVRAAWALQLLILVAGATLFWVLHDQRRRPWLDRVPRPRTSTTPRSLEGSRARP